VKSTAEDVRDEVRTRRGKGDTQKASEPAPQPKPRPEKVEETPKAPGEDKTAAPEQEEEAEPEKQREAPAETAPSSEDTEPKGEQPKQESKPSASIFDRY
jgi:hypothetical protein